MMVDMGHYRHLGHEVEVHKYDGGHGEAAELTRVYLVSFSESDTLHRTCCRTLMMMKMIKTDDNDDNS